MDRVVFTACLLFMGCARSPQRQPVAPQPSSAEVLIRAAVARIGVGEAAVAVVDLVNHTEILVNADDAYEPGALLALPILIEAYYRAEHDPTFSFDDLVVISNATRAGGRGSRVSANDTVAISALLTAAVVDGSRLALDMLLELLTPTAVQATLSALRVQDVQVDDPLHSGSAAPAGGKVVTARGIATLMARIAECHELIANVCSEIRKRLPVLEEKHTAPAITAARDTRGLSVVHVRSRYEAALVSSDFSRPIAVVVVLTRGVDPPISEALVQQILEIYMLRPITR